MVHLRGGHTCHEVSGLRDTVFVLIERKSQDLGLGWKEGGAPGKTTLNCETDLQPEKAILSQVGLVPPGILVS